MKLLPLRAGPLTMMFDCSNAFLRYVRTGDVELVRGVFAAIRDCNWNTIPFSIDVLEITQSEVSFYISFNANSLDRDIGFIWQGSVEGTADGIIHYRFQGMAIAPFKRNRIGLCVLHPSGQCAGKKCRIEHVDGTVTEGVFPVTISPHQPFRQIRAISHCVQSGLTARVSMTGDVFEMEDQRNWTDASYKTYSTPLDLPFPVHIEQGTRIEQAVSIELSGNQRSGDPLKVSPIAKSEAITCRVNFDWSLPISRPQLGFQWPSGTRAILDAVVDRLRALAPDHLRVDVWLNQSNWQKHLRDQTSVARSLSTKLEVAIFAESPTDESWRECMQLLQQTLPIARVLLFHTTSKTTPAGLAEDALKWLRATHPLTPIAVGTNAYFAELNRGRPSPLDQGPVCYSINPQVHAFDNCSLSESLEAQRDTVDSAVEVFARRVIISPVTLRPRFNPNATTGLDVATELEAAVDPRQLTGYGAAWTVGALGGLLTHTSVDSLTIYEAFGARGVISTSGREYPLTQPIESILRSKWLFASTSSLPLQAVGLASQSADGIRYVLLGNLSADELTIQFVTPSGKLSNVPMSAESVELIRLDEVVHA